MSRAGALPAGSYSGPDTKWAGRRIDLLAGLTVAIVGLPQCVAYAMMSGLPPEYGLSTAAVPGFVAAVLGRSPHLVTGPSNATGLLVLGALTPFLGANGLLRPESLPILATLTLLAGVVRLAAAFGGGAFLVRFLPESVLVGFSAGAGILIGVMQLDEALGLPAVRGAGLWAEFTGLVTSIQEGARPTTPAVLMAAATVAAIALGRRLFQRAPLALLAVAAAVFAAWVLGLDAKSGLPLVTDRSPVPSGWPRGALPRADPDLIEALLFPAMAISLLGTLELVVTARARGARPDLRREILAQGWANVAGAFSAAFPASVSLARSALLRLGGARSRLAAAFAALLTVPVVLMAGPALGRIPQASLAGVLLITAYGMVDRTTMRRMWRGSHESRMLLMVTLASTLLLPLEWAIFSGAGLGLLIHLARTGAPRLRVLRPLGGRLLPVAPADSPAVVVLEVSGDLHYAAVPPFLDEARKQIPPSAKNVVLDLSHAHQVRYSALLAFEQLADELAREGADLWLAGVGPDVQRLIERSGSNLPTTAAEAEAGLSVRNCLERLDRGREERG